MLSAKHLFASAANFIGNSNRSVHCSRILGTKKYKEALKKRQMEEQEKQDSLLKEYGLLERKRQDSADYVHPETPKYPNQYDVIKGKIYDGKPWRMIAKPGQIYEWCSCGQGHSQPLCDGMCLKIEGTHNVKTQPRFPPIKFEVLEECEVWLCNCKQTDSRPFCDGSHRKEDVVKEMQLREAPAKPPHFK